MQQWAHAHETMKPGNQNPLDGTSVRVGVYLIESIWSGPGRPSLTADSVPPDFGERNVFGFDT